MKVFILLLSLIEILGIKTNFRIGKEKDRLSFSQNQTNTINNIENFLNKSNLNDVNYNTVSSNKYNKQMFLPNQNVFSPNNNQEPFRVYVYLFYLGKAELLF